MIYLLLTCVNLGFLLFVDVVVIFSWLSLVFMFMILQDPDHGQWSKDSFFGSDDMGLNPIRTDSPDASNSFEKKEKSPFFFGDSVPSTPSFNSNSPRYSISSEDHQFESTFTKFDSFSIQDNASPKHNATFARFDSIRSTGEFDHGHGFSSFDDADLFGTGPFKSDNSTPKKK